MSIQNLTFTCRKNCSRVFNTNRGRGTHENWHNPEFANRMKEKLKKCLGSANIKLRYLQKNSEEYKKQRSETQKKVWQDKEFKNNFTGKNNPRWKGDEVSYGGLHRYIRKHKPIVSNCEDCNKSNVKLELANISKQYKRDVDDFKWLCPKCHAKFDKRSIVLRGKNNGKSKITLEQAREILKRKNESCKEIAKDYPIHENTVRNIIKGRTWKYVK